MYIWKTNKLSTDIKENNLTEKDWKQYFLAGGILLTVSMYLIQTTARTNMITLSIEALLMVVITVVGINMAFKTNQNNNGSNFVARITALSFPLTIKLIVVSIFFGIILGVANEMSPISIDQEEWAFAIFTTVIQVIFFWRINAHLTYINT